MLVYAHQKHSAFKRCLLWAIRRRPHQILRGKKSDTCGGLFGVAPVEFTNRLETARLQSNLTSDRPLIKRGKKRSLLLNSPTAWRQHACKVI
jgi:hypothetical protein